MNTITHKPIIETTSFSLHVMAMIFMLCDHLWATFLTNQEWLTCIGRLTFPIFAFLIVEGYFHTSNLKRYVQRLLCFAIISEIPFNLVLGGGVLYPYHQNVLWTFLIGIGLIWLNEKAKKTDKLWVRALTAVSTLCLGFILGILTMVDYHGGGVLMVLVFYFFHGRKWWCYLGQLVSMIYIHWELLGGLSYEIEFGGTTFFLVQQGIAVLALVPIWMYRGTQGYHSKAFQYFCYGFYPGHLLVLGLLMKCI